ncbi:MAG: DUF3810 domain-containing protein [Lachnospiraceae bacterium]|nr:DUF3810 domain-containing protein [Lachnospiraceae bacterium]
MAGTIIRILSVGVVILAFVWLVRSIFAYKKGKAKKSEIVAVAIFVSATIFWLIVTWHVDF